MAQEMPVLSIQNFVSEINALNSKIQVIAQRLKIIERNEEILGKTLISHNKALKELQDTMAGLKAGGTIQAEQAQPVSVPSGFDEQTIASLENTVDSLRRQQEQTKLVLDKVLAEINELKYVLDNINTVAYVTTDEVSELIDEKLRAAK